MQADLDLVPFDTASAAVVSGWATSAAEVSAWCAATVTPVPPEVVVGWSAEDDVHAFGVVAGGELIGYGELWVDAEEEEVELARLIVAPARRGRGVGRWLVDELTEHARTYYPTVYLRVRPDNGAARRSYEAAGYTRVSAEEEAAWNVGQPTSYVWMQAPPAA